MSLENSNELGGGFLHIIVPRNSYCLLPIVLLECSICCNSNKKVTNAKNYRRPRTRVRISNLEKWLCQKPYRSDIQIRLENLTMLFQHPAKDQVNSPQQSLEVEVLKVMRFGRMTRMELVPFNSTIQPRSCEKQSKIQLDVFLSCSGSSDRLFRGRATFRPRYVTL